ncbi:DUF883 family protein [Sphingomonas jeddahensis]|uniref:DUF883 domain-containing protein n=1 Tax=Sphingomonas jeddahensis TaxID=1915074 RepID=A0A1V2EYD3_9SPHN|nr:DUF883 family protein [Sphingomonas jeddahensis]ONF97189.1 hypothetical protein SPHI_06260 [Sphingomonas jeddahensis]
MTDTNNQTGQNQNGAQASGQDTLRDRASHAYESAVARAGDTVESSRDTARDAAHQAGDFIEGNPLGALAGGLAVGALIGALVPRSDREKQLLAPVGKTVSAAAVAALAAAKETGRGELEELGLTKDAARNQVKSLLKSVAKAASHAGTAAAQAGREEIKTTHG